MSGAIFAAPKRSIATPNRIRVDMTRLPELLSGTNRRSGFQSETQVRAAPGRSDPDVERPVQNGSSHGTQGAAIGDDSTIGRSCGSSMRSISRAVFAVGLLGLGVLTAVYRDFALQWQPVPAWVPARASLALLSGTVLLVGGAGLLAE